MVMMMMVVMVSTAEGVGPETGKAEAGHRQGHKAKAELSLEGAWLKHGCSFLLMVPCYPKQDEFLSQQSNRSAIEWK